VTTPSGLVNTSNIEDLLRGYVASARLKTDFDELPIPFRVLSHMDFGHILIWISPIVTLEGKEKAITRLKMITYI